MAKSLLKIVVAGVAGAVAGMLLAPKSGRETRQDIKLKAEELKNQTGDKVTDLKEAASRSKTKAGKTAKVAEKEARDFAQSAKKSGGAVKAEAGKLSAEAKERSARVVDSAKKSAESIEKDVKKSLK